MEPTTAHNRRIFGDISRKRQRHAIVNKHLRIANATTGHEHEVHVAKALKYAKRYRMSIKTL